MEARTGPLKIVIGEIPPDTAVWLVILKGLFYEGTEPTPVPTSSIPAETPVCKEIVSIVDATTAAKIISSFARQASC